MGMAAEARAAIGCLTPLRRLAVGAAPTTLAGGLAFYPAVGLAMGVVAAGTAHAIATVQPTLAGAVGVLALEVLSGGRPRRALAGAADALARPGSPAIVLERVRAAPGATGWVVAAGALVAKVAAATALPPPARTVALLIAPMLGRWAIAVLCYGGAPTHARGTAAALIGRARFREFGAASVTAFAVTLSLADAVGLLLVVIAALVTVGLRLWAYRRVGGLTGRLLVATGEVVETVVLVLLGALARRA
jgi:adenosylcobinamide-GDP ribazoletransferase